jgi:hypothetical protein
VSCGEVRRLCQNPNRAGILAAMDFRLTEMERALAELRDLIAIARRQDNDERLGRETLIEANE